MTVARAPATPWVAALHADERGARPLGAAVIIDGRRLVTAEHVLPMGEEVWASFPFSDVPMDFRLRATVLRRSCDMRDLAILQLHGTFPPRARPAPLRCPLPGDLVGRPWWAFGFGGGDPLGNGASGTVGDALAMGFVRLDSGSRYGLVPGFSGGGVWSEDYKAVVGIVSRANERGDGQAITFHEIDRCFPEERLRLLTRARPRDELALTSWGWRLADDPETGRHWVPRARGTSGHAGPDQWFRGRTAALNAIVAWLDRAETDARALVLTGSPGAGKSAVLGRVVTTADQVLRRELPADDEAVRARPGSVACAVHAKGKTALEIAEEIAGAASARLPAQPAELAEHLYTRLVDNGAERFNIVIDALDEAYSPAEARRVIRSIVLPVLQACAPAGAQVVIGTRRVDPAGDLLVALGEARYEIDLDRPEYCAVADVEAYARAVLMSSDTYADSAIAAPVANRIAALSDRNFLVAGLTAMHHALYDSVPADPATLTFAPGVDVALREYLARIPPVTTVPPGDLLAALAFAEPPGLPAVLWRIAVESLTGIPVSAAALTEFATSSAANFVIQTGSSTGDPVFRLFHQALGDALRHPGTDQQPLVEAFLAFGRARGWAHAPAYLLRSLAPLAARSDALDALLADDSYVLHADLPRLLSVADPSDNRARLLRLSMPHLTPDPAERAAALSVTETLENLGSSFRRSTRPLPYRAHWAQTFPRAELAVLEGHTDAVMAVCALHEQSGLTRLVSGGSDGRLRIGDPWTGTFRATLEGHRKPIRSVCALTGSDGRAYLASCDEGGEIRIWDPATGTVRHTLNGHRGVATGLCALPGTDGATLLVSCGQDEVVHVWDPSSGDLLHSLTGHDDVVTAVCALPSAEGRPQLATGCQRGTIRIWDVDTGRVLQHLVGHTDRIGALCPLPRGEDSADLVSVAWDRNVGVWSSETGTMVRTIGHGRHGDIGSACIFTSRDGRVLLAGACSDSIIWIWDVSTGEVLGTLTGHTGPLYSVCAIAGPEGEPLLASGSFDQTVRIWDPALADRSSPEGDTSRFHVVGQAQGRGKRGRSLRNVSLSVIPSFRTGPVGDIASICTLPGPDGLLLATGDQHGAVRLWNAATGAAVQVLAGHTGPVNAVCAFLGSTGRNLLASASWDQTVRIWDPDSGVELRHLSTIDASAAETSFAFAQGKSLALAMCAYHGPDGRAVLVTGGIEGLIRIWDPETGALQRTIKDHEQPIRAVSHLGDLEDASVLIAAEEDGALAFWALPRRRFARMRVWPVTLDRSPVTGLLPVPVSDSVSPGVLVRGDGYHLLHGSLGPLTHRSFRLRIGTPDMSVALRFPGPVTAACLLHLPSGETLIALGYTTRTVKIFRPDSPEPLLTVPVHHPVSSLTQVDAGVVVGLPVGLLALDLDLNRLDADRTVQKRAQP
ncbi:trypsin-like peptidase domain-containing protein [Streptomyces sp. NPDC059766]|uniref:trypsin-like peptidase domain-containing protein n=1 Tax=Streptomyces sp. NPDC059766 TaxID=3346940 RepID=UPI003669D447